MTDQEKQSILKEMTRILDEDHAKVYMFLERLESTTKDLDTANKIRKYLVEAGIWE